MATRKPSPALRRSPAEGRRPDRRGRHRTPAGRRRTVAAAVPPASVSQARRRRPARRSFVEMVQKRLEAGYRFPGSDAGRVQGRALRSGVPLPYGAACASSTTIALASRLSYFLWSSLPDDALLETAPMRGDSARPEVLRAETDRMLSDPGRSHRFTVDFLGAVARPAADRRHHSRSKASILSSTSSSRSRWCARLSSSSRSCWLTT